MEETSTLRKYVRNKKIFIPAFIGMVLLFFALIGITGDKIFALAVNEMAGYLVDNDSFGDVEFAIDDEEWEGEGTLQVSVSPGVFDEEKWASNEPPVELALVTPEGEVKKGEELLEEITRMAQADAAGETGEVQPLEAPEAGVSPDAEPEEQHEIVRGRLNAYTASYLRDPFYSLIRADRDLPNKLLDISRGRMVGSVWGEKSIIALLEDDAGRSYALKAGDKIVNGKVVSVSPASVTFSVTVFGLTKNVTLELAEEG
ncbi:MAG: hypothetical protein PVF95_02170 [bacterium]|jgi:hypothetical protein